MSSRLADEIYRASQAGIINGYREQSIWYE